MKRIVPKTGKLLGQLLVLAALMAFQNTSYAQQAQFKDSQGNPVAPPGAVHKLETEPLSIVTALGAFEFTVEIADEPQERTTGLMNRTSMPPRNGMLFDFGRTEQILMWMKNTYIPLDMIFIQPDGRVSHIAERTVPHSEAIVSSKDPASHVLEVNAGVAALIGLKPGDRIKHRFFDTGQ